MKAKMPGSVNYIPQCSHTRSGHNGAAASCLCQPVVPYFKKYLSDGLQYNNIRDGHNTFVGKMITLSFQISFSIFLSARSLCSSPPLSSTFAIISLSVHVALGRAATRPLKISSFQELAGPLLWEKVFPIITFVSKFPIKMRSSVQYSNATRRMS